MLSLLATNIEEVRLSHVLRSLLVCAGLVLSLLLLFRAVLGDWQKAAVLTSIATALAFSYGHLYTVLKDMAFNGSLLARHRYLVPILAVGYAAATWFVARRLRNLHDLSVGLTITSIAALVLPVMTILAHLRATSMLADTLPAPLPVQSDTAQTFSRPDVYYIILDAYSRSDVMQDVFGFDNSNFLAFLRDRGFYVADHSTSNYSLTRWSLSSSLNMTHVVDLFQPDQADSYAVILNEMIRHSAVRRRFEDMGYHTMAFATGWAPTEMTDAEIFLNPETDPLRVYEQTAQLNAFESMLLRSTILLSLNDLLYQRNRFVPQTVSGPYVLHYNFVLGQFAILDRIAALPSPKFVFVHIISPHPPYVFDAEGELLTNPEAFTLGDLGDTDMDPAEKGLYRDQAIFITHRIQMSLQAILAESASPPIVILQGDHGAKVNIDWANPSQESVRQSMSILNAYLLPVACESLLYPGITPVNSFAVVFHCIDGSDYGHQPDLNYFSSPETPLDLLDVTDLLH